MRDCDCCPPSLLELESPVLRAEPGPEVGGHHLLPLLQPSSAARQGRGHLPPAYPWRPRWRRPSPRPGPPTPSGSSPRRSGRAARRADRSRALPRWGPPRSSSPPAPPPRAPPPQRRTRGRRPAGRGGWCPDCRSSTPHPSYTTVCTYTVRQILP